MYVPIHQRRLIVDYLTGHSGILSFSSVFYIHLKGYVKRECVCVCARVRGHEIWFIYGVLVLFFLRSPDGLDSCVCVCVCSINSVFLIDYSVMFVCLCSENQEGSQGGSWNQVYRCLNGWMASGMQLMLIICTQKSFSDLFILIFRFAFSSSNLCLYNLLGLHMFDILFDYSSAWLGKFNICFSKPANKEMFMFKWFACHWASTMAFMI